MTPEQFCYWLQGRAEMQPDNPPTAAEWQMIREHLATVFQKVTPTLNPVRFDDLRHIPPTVLPQPSVEPYTVKCAVPADKQVTTLC